MAPLLPIIAIAIAIVKGGTSVQDIIHRFHSALPQIRAWIDEYLESHVTSARNLDDMPPLSTAFPREVLGRARMVLVSRTPFPPVSQSGLPEFAQHERRGFDGITFKNTLFVVDGRQTLRLQFHELVHTVQWARLGVDRFLLAYGIGLLLHGYEQSPLEKMAYTLEQQFLSGALPTDLVRVTEQDSDTVRKEVASIVGMGS